MASTRPASAPSVARSRPELVAPTSTLGRWVHPPALVWALVLVLLLGQVVLYLVHVAALLPYPFDVDQGEAYDVNSGWLLAQGRPIYTDNEHYPYYSSNYPPVYSLVVAGVIKLFGPSLPTGRAVSLGAVGVLAVLIWWAARDRAGGPGGPAAVGLFFLSPYVFHTTALARVNSLTACLALGGLLALGATGPRRRWLGCLLLLLALFAKPTAIDAAVAGLGALVWRRRRAGLVAGVSLAGVALALLLGLEVGSGGAFSLNVLAGNVNPFLPAQLAAYWQNFTLLHAVPLLLAACATARAARAGRLDGLHLFWATGLVLAIGVGKWGAGESYFLSAIVASSILAGREIGLLAERQPRVGLLAALAVAAQVAVSAHGELSARWPALPDRGLQASALGRRPGPGDLERGYAIVSRLESQTGPALLEEAGFGLAIGREVVGNATQLRNLQQAGRFRGEALVADLIARRYHTVVLDAELYPEPVLAAIGRNYFLFDTVTVYGAEQKVFVPGAL